LINQITDVIFKLRNIIFEERVVYIYYKISYSLVVILELNSGLEVQYKKIIIIGDE